MKTLKTLVKRSKQGDGDAFVSLVQQYEDVLYKTASRLLNNDEDVADAMQDAIIMAFEKLHTLRKAEHFNTWIYKILLNECNRILNKKKNYSKVSVEIIPEHRSDDFQKLELEDALNSLNEDYKTAFILYYFVGLNTREMSVFLNEPEGTIKSRLSRGKSLLRNNYYNIGRVISNEN